MSITFTWDGRPSLISKYEGKREGASRVLTKAEALACGQHGLLEDVDIEIRPGAYDAEVIAALEAGEAHLKYDDYGVSWRAWHGHPYQWQMETEPWNELGTAETAGV